MPRRALSSQAPRRGPQGLAEGSRLPPGGAGLSPRALVSLFRKRTMSPHRGGAAFRCGIPGAELDLEVLACVGHMTRP